MCTDFNDRILVVRELWWGGIWIELDISRNQLIKVNNTLQRKTSSKEALLLTCAETNNGRGPASAKKPT